jgi:hypothetical protein
MRDKVQRGTSFYIQGKLGIPPSIFAVRWNKLAISVDQASIYQELASLAVIPQSIKQRGDLLFRQSLVA